MIAKSLILSSSNMQIDGRRIFTLPQIQVALYHIERGVAISAALERRIPGHLDADIKHLF